MTMKNVLSRPSRVCLGILGSASATDRMVFPDFQPKLGIWGCGPKVRGGLGREPRQGCSPSVEVSNRRCAQEEWRHPTNPHSHAQACGHDLWITPPRRDEVPWAGLPTRGCRRLRGAGACGKREPRSLSANRLLCMRRLLGLGGWGVRQSIENDMALLYQP